MGRGADVDGADVFLVTVLGVGLDTAGGGTGLELTLCLKLFFASLGSSLEARGHFHTVLVIGTHEGERTTVVNKVGVGNTMNCDTLIGSVALDGSACRHGGGQGRYEKGTEGLHDGSDEGNRYKESGYDG